MLRRTLCHHIYGALEASPCVGMQFWFFLLLWAAHVDQSQTLDPEDYVAYLIGRIMIE